MIWTDGIRAELVQHTGSDVDIARAAWVSTRGQRAEDEADADRVAGLIRFLVREKHGTPFEHNSMTFLVSAPIFVWREHHRHRIGISYNEESGRYRQLEPKFYLPAEARVQEGKPGAYTYAAGTDEQTWEVGYSFRWSNTQAYKEYKYLLDAGIAREVARMVLPVNIFSSCYVTFNARSLMNFLALRLAPNAQAEIRKLAALYRAEFERLFPVTAHAFGEWGAP